MKKIIGLITILLLAFTIAGCTEPAPEIKINVDTSSVTIIEGEKVTLGSSTNDVGITFTSSDEEIATVDATGKITAISEGTATIYLTSVTQTDFQVEVEVTVRKLIDLTSEVTEITLEEEQTHQVVVTSNDDVSYEIVDQSIAQISEDGIITGLSEGTTTLKVTSTYDTSKVIEIDLIITKKITLDVTKTEYMMVEGDTSTIEATSNDGLTYISGSNNIVTVSETGEIEAVGFGTTTIRIESTYNSDVFEYVNITVFKYTEAITITGDAKTAKGTFVQLMIETDPVGAYDEVTWESGDATLATVSETGLVEALAPGSVDIIAKSVLDDTIIDTFTIEIISIAVVQAGATTGDTYTYEGVTLVYGQQLFASLDEAINQSIEGTSIYITPGTYSNSATIDVNDIEIIGLDEGVIFTNTMTISANDVLIDMIEFREGSRVINDGLIENLVFSNNHVDGIITDFMTLTNVNNIQITNNIFEEITGTIITFNGVLHGDIIIEENNFTTSTTGIKMDTFTDVNNAVVKVFFNHFDYVITSMVVDYRINEDEATIFKAARFNSFTNYTTALSAHSLSTFDFTLNYFDVEDEGTFVCVQYDYRKGAYETAEEMPTKDSYNPNLPILITVTNPITEISVGDTHTYTYEILPLELSDAPVKFITGNPGLVAIQQDGTITPLMSGATYIQIRSAVVSSIRTQTNFSIITTPGVELYSDHFRNNLVVNETFKLDAILFPYTIENDGVTFQSSDQSVATVDQDGNVTTTGIGTATIKATLNTDSTIFSEYTLSVHDTLDMSNPLDYMTYQQISYSTVHSWIAQGFEYKYNDSRAESVSRYYFGDIVINDTKMVPENSYGIRPTEPMDPIPDGYTQYNPENIYWVVVHDTAGAMTGSGALAHANYLYNAAQNGTALWVSWHYTIDSEIVYQHLPENERGYHAGDGSTNPGDGSYLGGGNRNGIGIEMAINDDGDMMRTWQRTAKLVVEILNRNNLPRENQKFHQDFSGKKCPNTLITAGLVPLFNEFVDVEYEVARDFSDTTFAFTSNNPEILDNHGRILYIPDRAITVSYTISATTNGVTESRTFYTYIPGSVR